MAEPRSAPSIPHAERDRGRSAALS